MTSLRALLEEGLRPGVYRWPDAPGADDVRRDALAEGFGFVLLDTGEIHDKAGFLDLCATAFDLPRWFGRNWDALADSLSDRSTGAPEVVLWTGLRHLLEHDHDTVDVALQIFAEDTTNSGQLRVLVAETETSDLLSSLPVL
ncbi:barstar family protein [Kribbella sp. NPDC051936]|uniref:barstar family protein n=1 Tax=Kribbella sp. NPDC051936 TaxID=3154946 RepID=UPI003425D255